MSRSNVLNAPFYIVHFLLWNEWKPINGEYMSKQSEISFNYSLIFTKLLGDVSLLHSLESNACVRDCFNTRVASNTFSKKITR